MALSLQLPSSMLKLPVVVGAATTRRGFSVCGLWAKSIIVGMPQPRSQGLSSLPPLSLRKDKDSTTMEAEKRDPGNEVGHALTFVSLFKPGALRR